MLAEVARQVDDAHEIEALPRLEQGLQRSVATAVVDEDQLELLPQRCGADIARHHTVDFRAQGVRQITVAVDRHNDGVLDARRAHAKVFI